MDTIDIGSNPISIVVGFTKVTSLSTMLTSSVLSSALTDDIFAFEIYCIRVLLGPKDLVLPE